MKWLGRGHMSPERIKNWNRKCWRVRVDVSRDDLCLFDGLCVQSLVLWEHFKWEINVKRPFMAPSNKQLDSSFCLAFSSYFIIYSWSSFCIVICQAPPPDLFSVTILCQFALLKVSIAELLMVFANHRNCIILY